MTVFDVATDVRPSAEPRVLGGDLGRRRSSAQGGAAGLRDRRSEVARLIVEQADDLRARIGRPLELVGIAVRRAEP